VDNVPLASPSLASSAAPASVPRPLARLALVAKIVISAALLVYLSRKIVWDDVAVRLETAAPLILAAALVLMIGTIFLAALRWKLLVRGEALTLKAAVQLSFAGMFFGQVLPATVGGDVVRGVLAGRAGLAWGEVVASIVLDRITALLASVILILAGLPALANAAVGVSVAGTALVSVGLAVAIAVGLHADRLPLPASLAHHAKVASLRRLVGRLRVGLLSKAGAAALMLSLVIHLTTVMIVVMIGAGFGIAVTPLAAFLVVPFAVFAAAVPISVNGWGVREGLMVSGLGLFGVASGDALLISVVLGLSVIVAVLPGSLTWLALR
jgi:uncharacterized membrane protein YbhN (UPF0104 family)